MLSSFDRSRAEQVDERDVILLIDQFVNEKAQEDYFANLKLCKDKSPNPSNLTVFKNVEVKYDADTDRTYCDLPAAYIQLPDDKGLYSISPMKDMINQFIAIRSNALWAYGNSQASGLQNNIGFYPEENKAIFDRDIIALGYTEVLIREFISSSANIADDAPYPVSPEDEKYIVTEVFKLLVGVNSLPNDKVNDNRKSE